MNNARKFSRPEKTDLEEKLRSKTVYTVGSPEDLGIGNSKKIIFESEREGIG